MFRTLVSSKFLLAVASCSLILCGCDAAKSLLNSDRNAITGSSSQGGSAGYSGIVENDPWQDGYQLPDDTQMISAPAATPPNSFANPPADPFANLPVPNSLPNSGGMTPPPSYPPPGFPSPGYSPPGFSPPGQPAPGYSPTNPGFSGGIEGSPGYPSPGYPGPGYSPGGIPPGFPPNRF